MTWERLPEDPEVKVAAIVSVEQEGDNAVACLINRSSSWTCLLRVIAWILRFKALLLNIRKRKESDANFFPKQYKHVESCGRSLSLEEIKGSELEIIMFYQRQKYAEELSCLRRRQCDGVLRVGGWLSKAVMPEES